MNVGVSPTRPQVQKLNPKHQEIMNWLLMNPERSMTECARTFGVTQQWLSCIVHSDIFQARYQKLLGEDVDSRVLPLRDRITNLAHGALEKLEQKLPGIEDPNLLLDLGNKMVKNLGFGTPKVAQNFNQLNVISSVSPEELKAAREVHRQFQRRLADESKTVAVQAPNDSPLPITGT